MKRFIYLVLVGAFLVAIPASHLMGGKSEEPSSPCEALCAEELLGYVRERTPSKARGCARALKECIEKCHTDIY